MIQSPDLAPLPVEGTYNLRRVAGTTADGRALREGKLFRSDALHGLTADGTRAVAELGIRLVVDLRGDDERAKAPSRLDPEVVVVHAPTFREGGAAALPDGGITLSTIYDDMIDHRGAELAEAVRHIATSGEAPVLVHCTAGKDRTGLVVALALLAVGVPREQVIADYASTAANLAGEWADRMLDAMRTAGVPSTPELEEIVTASPAAEIARVIDRWESGWGSAAAYLAANGLTEAELAALGAALLD